MEVEEITLDIYKISRCTHTYYARELKKIGVTMGQFPFLIGITENDGISQEKLSGNLRISKSTTAVIIKQLVDAGLATREVDTDDRRNFKLHTTQKAQTLVPQIYEIINKCHETICRGLSIKEREQFSATLEKTRKNADKLR